MYNFSQLILSHSEDVDRAIKSLKNSDIRVCFWQKEDETGGARIVSTGVITKANVSADNIQIKCVVDSFLFKPAPSIYAFIDDINILFKTNIRSSSGHTMDIYFPSRLSKVYTQDDDVLFGSRLAEMSDIDIIMESLERLASSATHDKVYTLNDLNKSLQKLSATGKLLENRREDYASGELTHETYSLDDLLSSSHYELNENGENGGFSESAALHSLQQAGGEIEIDNEEEFMDQRTTPRSAPKGFKTITLNKVGSVSDDKEYVLYDLSQGGMAFNTWVAAEFQQGQEIVVTKIGEKYLSPKMKGIVRSIRKVTEDSEEVKVGVQFIS